MIMYLKSYEELFSKKPFGCEKITI